MRSKKLGKVDAANGTEVIESVHIQEHFFSHSIAG
jgi:hypothetical protein